MNVLVMIPVKPTLNRTLRSRCALMAERLAPENPSHNIAVYMDNRAVSPEIGDARAWSKVSRIRNAMLDAVNWHLFDYICWIDADVVDYPATILSRLLECAEGGIAAPMVFVENTFRFYDWTAFIMEGKAGIQPTVHGRIPGRNLSPEPPYWPTVPKENVVPMDCVGTFYVVHTDIYESGARHFDHVAHTDHYSVCKVAHDMARKVVVVRDVSCAHADLPKYAGESWH